MSEKEKDVPSPLPPTPKPLDPIEQFRKERQQENPLDLERFERVDEDVREHEEEQGE